MDPPPPLHNLRPLCRSRFHHLTLPFTSESGRQSQNMINQAESCDTQETHKRPVPRGVPLTADLLCARNRQASYSRTTAITPAFFHISHWSCFKFSKNINLFFFHFINEETDKNHVSDLPKATQLSDQAVPRLHPAPSISINRHFISTTSTDGGNHQGRPWV